MAQRLPSTAPVVAGGGPAVTGVVWMPDVVGETSAVRAGSWLLERCSQRSS
jgi:hypothetical protein